VTKGGEKSRDNQCHELACAPIRDMEGAFPERLERQSGPGQEQGPPLTQEGNEGRNKTRSKGGVGLTPRRDDKSTVSLGEGTEATR